MTRYRIVTATYLDREPYFYAQHKWMGLFWCTCFSNWDVPEVYKSRKAALDAIARHKLGYTSKFEEIT